ncbi:MAG: hypothetical protein AAGF01_31840 [Cyanobacteria bacterium P01_G01_bin.38]
MGKKRMLYQSLSIFEYWVVDVKKAQVIIFANCQVSAHAIANRSSRRIETSLV